MKYSKGLKMKFHRVIAAYLSSDHFHRHRVLILKGFAVNGMFEVKHNINYYDFSR
jgi:hypothetical protein